MADIKIPAGGGDLERLWAATDTGSVDASEAQGPVEAAAATEVGQAPEVNGPGAVDSAVSSADVDPLEAIAADVRVGTLSPEQAVDQLVERALGEVAASLTPAQQDELRALLRAAVADDPTLGALGREIAEG